MYILKIGKYKDFYYNLSVFYDPFLMDIWILVISTLLVINSSSNLCIINVLVNYLWIVTILIFNLFTITIVIHGYSNLAPNSNYRTL